MRSLRKLKADRTGDIENEGLDVRKFRPDGTAYGDPATVLSQCVLRQSLPRPTFRALRRGRGVGVILVVRSGWLATIRDALQGSCANSLRVVICLDATDQQDIQTALRGFASDAAVAILVTDPKDVPMSARMLCSETHVIDRIPPEAVRQTLRQCTHGRVPRDFEPPLENLPLGMVSSSIVSGGPTRSAMRTLSTLADPPPERTPEVERPREELPPLEECVEFGAAQEWGLQLGRDITAWKEGKLQASDLDSSILLVSPPGFGKTTYAKILQQHLDIPMHRLGIAEIFSGNGYLNTSMKNITNVFEEARATAPSIIFMDEVDNVQERSEGRNNDAYFNSLVNHFLVLIDGADSDMEGVILIGSTNRPDAVDPAMRRPGRLSTTITIEPPNVAGREHVLRTHLRGDLAGESLNEIALASEGMSPAQLMHLCVRARAKSRNHGRPLAVGDLMGCLETGTALSSELRWRIAVHESGHAVMAVVAGNHGLNLVAASVVRSGSTGGSVQFDAFPDLAFSREEMEARVVVLLGGRAAETVLLGGSPSSGTGGSENSDLAKATTMIAAAVGSHGMIDDAIAWRGPPESAIELMRFDPMFRGVVEQGMRTLLRRADELARRHRVAIEVLARELIERLVVPRARIEQIVLENPPQGESDEERLGEVA